MSDEEMKASVNDIMKGFLKSAPNHKYLVSTPNAYEIKMLEQEKQRREEHDIILADSLAEHFEFAKYAMKNPTQGPKQSWSCYIPNMCDFQDALGCATMKTGVVLERKTYFIEIKQVDPECTKFCKRFLLTNTRNPYTSYPIFWNISGETPLEVKNRNLGMEGKFKVTVTDN